MPVEAQDRLLERWGQIVHVYAEVAQEQIDRVLKSLRLQIYSQSKYIRTVSASKSNATIRKIERVASDSSQIGIR